MPVAIVTTLHRDKVQRIFEISSKQGMDIVAEGFYIDLSGTGTRKNQP